MSGDAQPRKRKNKGKKKDETSGEAESGTGGILKPSSVHGTPSHHTVHQDEVIHVQKDVVCGGNPFTKLVFFALFAALSFLLALIILQYRGAAVQESAVEEDSPWAVTLGDWIDKEPDIHHHVSEEISGEEEEIEHDLEHEHEEEEEKETEGSHEESDTGGGQEQVESGYSMFSFFGLLSSGDERNGAEEGGEVEAEEAGGSWLSLIGLGGAPAGEEEEEAYSAGSWFGFGSSDEGPQEPDEPEEPDVDEPLEDLEESEENEEEEEEEETEGSIEEEESYTFKKASRLGSHKKAVSEEVEEDEVERDEAEEEEEEEEEEASREELDEEESQEVQQEKVASDEILESGEDEGIEEDDEEEKDEREEDTEAPEEEREQEEEDEDKGERDLSEEDEGFQEEEDKEIESPIEEDESEEGDDNNEKSSEKEDEEVGSEELFPEAREALRREREEQMKLEEERMNQNEDELTKSDDETNEIESETPEEPQGEEEETEGVALKFGVGVALIVVAHVVLVKKWKSWGGEDAELFADERVTTELNRGEEREIYVERQAASVQSSPAPPPPPPVQHHQPAQPVASPQDESDDSQGENEEEEGGGDEGDAEEESDVEIDQDKFKELIAKYGQETSEDSELEPSEDENKKVSDYSEGEESGGEVSPGEISSEDEEPASDGEEVNAWTGLGKEELERITRLDTGSEDEEEESEDEEPTPAPAPAQGRRTGGGARDAPEQNQEAYENEYITNDEDWLIREELDRVDQEFNYDKARAAFEELLRKWPDSPRARYGLALSLDRLAEERRSNRLLDEALAAYQRAVAAPRIPPSLLHLASTRLIQRLRFRGHHIKAVDVHNNLIQKFNNTAQYRIDLAITYLMINNLKKAETVLKEVLEIWPEDPVALSHYGLTLKLQGDNAGCIDFLLKGIKSEHPQTKDARFYFHLGDALSRLGRVEEAYKVYAKGVEYGLFRSLYQRSLYNVDRLTARPWWNHNQTTYSSFFKLLEEHWLEIRDEGERALRLTGTYQDEAENLRDRGDWKQFQLFARGQEMKKNCESAPVTCGLVRRFDKAARCSRGQVKFSVMEGGTHVWPHCGPTNCRLRAHLGLRVPPGAAITVAQVTRLWEEGKVIVFDDSFEHEVWHNGTSLRLVLIVDVWHPELTREETATLSPI